jgi:hypothetical protein
MKKIINIMVEIESDTDFNLDELAVGKYVDDESSDGHALLISEGTLEDDKYFRVNDYIKVEDVTSKVETKRKECIAVMLLNNKFNNEQDYKDVYDTFDKDEKEEIEKEKFQI